jgi:hypothetical protein
VFITIGVLMLRFVTHELWWTNVRASAAADKETSSLQNDWAPGKGAPGVFGAGAWLPHPAHPQAGRGGADSGGRRQQSWTRAWSATTGRVC